jgi:hypothetical protein
MLIDVDAGAGPRRIDLFSLLAPEDEERAHEDAYAWIKAVRHLRVDGDAFRSRFTMRGDSLWWFAELYLHKEQAILQAMRVVRAFDALVERDRPRAVHASGGRQAAVVAAAADARGVAYSGRRWRIAGATWMRFDAAAVRLSAAARLSRLYWWTADTAWSPPSDRSTGGRDGSAESCIGPISPALSRGRRRDDPLRRRRAANQFRAALVDPRAPAPTTPSSQSSDPAGLRDAGVARRVSPAASRCGICGQHGFRNHAVIRGVDCWPPPEQLAGTRCSAPGRPARWTRRPPLAAPARCHHYAEAGGWRAGARSAPRACRSPACSTVIPPLAELSPRGG